MSAAAASRKVALVSGANRGIGAAIAQALLDAGYAVSLGARQPSQLEAKFGAETSTRIHCAYDATDARSAEAWVERTERELGRIDALVNNAGIAEWTQLTSEFGAAFDRMMAVNVKAPWKLTQLCLPSLQRAGTGRVVFISSIAGKRVGKGGNLGYAMTKACVLMLNEAVRSTTWENGVRSTVICPGWVNTDMASGCTSVSREDMTQPEDVARLVVMAVQLPNNASVAEISVNCKL